MICPLRTTSDRATERTSEASPLRVLSLASYTLPVHALLPVVIALLGWDKTRDQRERPCNL